MRAGSFVRWPAAGVGEELALEGRLEPLRDFDAHHRRRGAHAVLLVRAARTTGTRRGGLEGLIDTLRRRAEAGLEAGLPPSQAALLRGMVLGQDEALDRALREDFRTSGLAHLVAASGQNVMLLAALALPLLALLGAGRRARLLWILGLIALYVPLAGAGPSIQRAGIMGAAGIVAGLAGRPSSRWYAVGLAAAATLVLNPRASGDPGWQLSFAAVIAILALARPLRTALVRRRVPGALADALALTLAATLGTAPLLAHHFAQVSLVSVPANLLAAPAVAPIMWLGMVSAAAGEVAPDLSALVNALALAPLAFLEWVARAAASVPAASVTAPLASGWAVAGAYAGLALGALAIARVGRSRRGRMGLAVAAIAATAYGAFAWASVAAPGPPDEPTVSFLDVGQGDATLIQDGATSILVDTGPPGSPLLERLEAAGVTRIDLLVVTHAQADHEGGAAAVLERFPVGTLLDGGADATTPAHAAIVAAAGRRGVRRVAPDVGQTLRVGRFALRIMWPRHEPAALHAGVDPNDRAIVAHLRLGAFDLLLPADAESNVTALLDLPVVEALKVAHHGSSDEGLATLVERLRPQVAVIEVGDGNSYGHPTAQALGALAPVRHVRRTDRDGTVRLVVGEDGRVRLEEDG